METMKFKTNLKCSGCVAKVTPFLDEVVPDKKWEVDINDPGKVLTVPEGADQAKVKQALEKAGYKAELI
jgi:copper chaperone